MPETTGGESRTGAPAARDEAEARYCRAHDALPHAIALFDQESRIVYANPAVLRLTGQTSAVVTGRRPDELWEPEITGLILPALEKARETRATHETFADATIADLGRRSFHIRWIPLLDASGAVREVMAVVEDVTERVANERRIERLTRIHQTLADTNEAIVRAADVRDLFQRICDVTLRLGGLGLVAVLIHEPRDETLCTRATAGILSPSFSDLRVPVSRAGYQGHAVAAAFLGERVVVEDPYAAKPGVPRGIAAACSLPLRYGGKVVGVLGLAAEEVGYFDEEVVGLLTGMVQDLSYGLDHLAHERRLAESEAQYRMLVENMDDVVFSLDGEGVFTFVSSAIARYGFAPQDVIGQPFYKFMHVDDVAVHLARWGQAEAGRRATADVRVIDGTGKVRFVRGMARPVLVGDRLVAVQGILTDMTQQREMEAQLRTAQKMEAVGRLAGGVAHDFNNLLMVIASYTELAMDSLPPCAPAREDLEEVRKAALRATGLTRQLLAFSRKQVLRPEVLDLNALVAGMEKMLRRLIGEDVLLDFAPGASLGATLADAGQLEQVLMNLAVNARDAMPQGGSLRIATANAEIDHEVASHHLGLRPGSWVKMAVTDTGTGMDEATVARIFEPFFTTKAAGKGTGLGLAMVYGIVAQSGGGVWVKSRPGEGTTFEIYLPRSSGSRPDEPRESVGGAEPRARAAAEGILLVEDDDEVRKLTRRMLVAAGHPVVCAASGAEALKLCASDAVDARLLVTDVVLPGLNGRALWERLEKLRPGLRVLYISGYTDDAISERAGLAGLEAGVEILCKPFTADVLARTVRAILDR